LPTILVVDDDPDIRQLVAELLRLSAYDAVTASSGVEAIDRLAGGAERPSLVLLDVQMPELDGWATLRTIRADPALDALPVVLCTVKSSATDTALGWTLGCDGYVVKPFAIADLVAEIEVVLNAGGPRQRAARRAQALREIRESATDG
jgi:two-component system OmpR family response regulator